jgi:hypothetical protein
MRCGRSSASVLLLFGALAAHAGCGRKDQPPPPVQQNEPAAPATGVPHGDHNPHHGGVVMMKGDLHYEVVMDPSGQNHRVFFTDAVREDLPASVASDVVLTIRRPHAPDEIVPLRIDDSGESWEGSSNPVNDPPKTAVHVAFTMHGEPYSIDLPFTIPHPAS